MIDSEELGHFLTAQWRHCTSCDSSGNVPVYLTHSRPRHIILTLLSDLTHPKTACPTSEYVQPLPYITNTRVSYETKSLYSSQPILSILHHHGARHNVHLLPTVARISSAPSPFRSICHVYQVATQTFLAQIRSRPAFPMRQARLLNIQKRILSKTASSQQRKTYPGTGFYAKYQFTEEGRIILSLREKVIWGIIVPIGISTLGLSLQALLADPAAETESERAEDPMTLIQRSRGKEGDWQETIIMAQRGMKRKRDGGEEGEGVLSGGDTNSLPMEQTSHQSNESTRPSDPLRPFSNSPKEHTPRNIPHITSTRANNS